MNGELSAQGGVVLAEEVKDWSEAFERLRDSALRRSLAAAGRQLVKESYSVQAWAPKLARIYRNLAPRR
jgi:glycosyltransferase involved in cell wall biosynthesis